MLFQKLPLVLGKYSHVVLEVLYRVRAVGENYRLFAGKLSESKGSSMVGRFFLKRSIEQNSGEPYIGAPVRRGLQL